MLQFCKTRCTWIRSCWFPSLTVQDSFKILTHLKSIYTSLCLISFSLQKCIKIGKITIPRSRNFRLGREPSVTGRSPPNPSVPLERSSQAGNGSSVTPITGSPVFHPCYYGRTPFPPPPPRYTFPPFPFAKEERRGERAESRRIHHEEGSQRRGTTRTRPDRTRRLSYPPCTAATAVFQPLRWCVIAWRKPWLQPAAGAPCITSDPSREETSVSAACIVIEWYNKGRAKPVGNGRNGTTWRAFGPPHSPEEEDEEEEEEGESAG